jgi:selenocysteine lyase/cysteine desulfurase
MSEVPRAYLDEFSEPAGYLEFASTGPVSHRVRAAVDRALAALETPEGAAVEPFVDWYRSATERAARLLGTAPERVAVLDTTSTGLFHVAFGLIGTAGNVVVAAHEFPANVYPWLRARDAGGPVLRLIDVPDLRVTPERIAAAVDRETVAVAVSLVDFRTGFAVDLPGLREAAGDALLVVDGIQGIGAIRARLDPADVIVAGGQKWLRAGWGAGLMAVSDRALDRLAPTLTGWVGVADFLDTATPAPHAALADAGRFQVGSPPMLGAVRLAAALEVLEIAGIEAIERVVRDRVERLLDVVAAAGAEVLAPWRFPGERAGILTFRLPEEDPAVTAARLEAAGLVVSQRAGWLRVAPHASTVPEAAGMLAEAL